MKCPYCSCHDTKVVDKRETVNHETTRRRRECLKCKKRFTTYERVELVDLFVVKKDRNVERFERRKILNGILKACEKRPIKIDKIEKLVDEVETELRKKDKTEIKSSLIGKLIMDKMRKLDKVAYIRFASVYRDFADLRRFEKEVEKLLKTKT